MLVRKLVRHESTAPAILTSAWLVSLVREAETSTSPIYALPALRAISEWPNGVPAFRLDMAIFKLATESPDLVTRSTIYAILNNIRAQIP